MCGNLIKFSLLSNDLKHSISELLRESRSFNKNDVLVHADPESNRLFFSESIGTMKRSLFPGRILKEAHKTFKESGINPLCLAAGFLISKDGEQRSPIVLTPLKVKEDRVRGEITIAEKEGEEFINPYIEFLLLEYKVDAQGMEVSNAFDFLAGKGFEIENPETFCIGNFHHHRYSVLREMDELLHTERFSGPLRSIFGEKVDPTPVTLPDNCLFAADVDHEKVFRLAQQASLVVQGPPGTGKSQVLSNLIGKLLSTRQSALILSEKRVALEIIQQKLGEFGLDRLGYVATSDNEVHDFLQELQENWFFFEQMEDAQPVDIQLSRQYENQLQFTLDVLNQPDAVGGISLYDFKKWMRDVPKAATVFVNNPPSVPSFLAQKDGIELVYASDLHEPIALLKSGTLQRDNFEELLPDLRFWIAELEELHRTVPFETWEDFTHLMRLAGWCQILENARSKNQEILFKPDSRAQKKFLKHFKELQRVETALEQLPVQSHWTVSPGREDVSFLKKLAQNTSYLGRRSFKKSWSNYSRLPISEASNAFEAFDKKAALEDDKSRILLEFCDLNILDGKKEAELLHLSIGMFHTEHWEETQKLSGKIREALTELHSKLNTLYSALHSTLHLHSETPLITQLKTLESGFPRIVSNHQQLTQLDGDTLSVLRLSPTFDSLVASIAYSHWTLFQQRFPTFSQFELSDIHTKVDAVIQALKDEARGFANIIRQSSKKRFHEYQELLSTPARKLNAEQKELKQRLRKGKSILVKEFAKTRSHPTMRELFTSEAREWIQILKPIWLSNPTQIAKAFPLENGLFDIVIFDEASQIPLQNALGALQRSKHGIIAGDSQQMGPSSYFQTGNSEVMDLLHQASFYWQNIQLNHHYRSVHPALIAFSNKHFYAGKLQAYPAYNTQTPIQHHFVENGCFEERRNTTEGTEVAAFIQQSLNNSDSLGIVAFSEEQLQCIREQLDTSTLKRLTERMENGTAFFKTLENVQGDECDHLILSFGYARDTEGSFAMRFGPMNTANGRRRLNVLLTRARKKLDWFSSVQSTDFKLSDNESINLLRQWFLHLESFGKSDALALPFNLPFMTEGNTLTLVEGHKHLSEAREFVTFQQVMEARGWNIQYA